MAKRRRTAVGIIGGGQLARMMAERAARLDLEVHVLDPSPDCPAYSFARSQIVADFDDPKGLEALAARVDVITFDIERGDLATLDRLVKEGVAVRPSPNVLRIIRDKLTQRQVLADNGLPGPRFKDVDGPLDQIAKAFGYPVVQKARRDGYDGRGVVRLNGASDLEKALPVPSLIEEAVDIAAELAVVIVRSTSGAIRCYPTIQTLVDPDRAVLDALLFPAPVSPEISRRAWTLSIDAITALDGVGSFTVELFLDTAGELFINEISPRPHNAGHVTIEAAETCQFEQHLRAITGLPLGASGLVRPAAMVNLFGQGLGRGPTAVDGLSDALSLAGARVHLYGKQECWPGRKMGHLTVLADETGTALHRARRARDQLSIRGDRGGEVAA